MLEKLLKSIKYILKPRKKRLFHIYVDIYKQEESSLINRMTNYKIGKGTTIKQSFLDAFENLHLPKTKAFQALSFNEKFQCYQIIDNFTDPKDIFVFNFHINEELPISIIELKKYMEKRLK